MRIGPVQLRAARVSSRRTAASAGYLYAWAMVRGWFIGVAVEW